MALIDLRGDFWVKIGLPPRTPTAQHGLLKSSRMGALPLKARANQVSYLVLEKSYEISIVTKISSLDSQMFC